MAQIASMSSPTEVTVTQNDNNTYTATIKDTSKNAALKFTLDKKTARKLLIELCKHEELI